MVVFLVFVEGGGSGGILLHLGGIQTCLPHYIELRVLTFYLCTQSTESKTSKNIKNLPSHHPSYVLVSFKDHLWYIY